MQKYTYLTKEAWKLLRPFHRYFYIHLVMIFLISAIGVYVVTVEGRIFTAIANKDIQNFYHILITLVGLYTVLTVVTFLREYNEKSRLDHDIAQHLQHVSFSKILHLTVEQHIEDHSAIKQQIIVRGENAVEAIIKAYINDFFPNILYIILSLVALTYYNIYVGLASFFFAFILALWMNHFLNFYKPLVKKNRDNWTEQGRTRTEAFTHLQLIKLLGREDYFITKYLEKRKGFANFGKYINILAVRHRGKKNAYSEGSQLILLITVGLLTFTGGINLATVYVVWYLVARLFWAVSGLSNALRDLPLRYTESEQYFEAIEKKPLFSESGVKDIDFMAPITFTNVTFSYPKSTQPVFTNLSCTILPGKVTAFVGSSGSGKSTIVKLLLRAYSYSTGNITLGDTELQKIDAHHLREHIGYVEQHVDLLDDTVLENILIGVPTNKRHEAEKKIDEIAKLTRIDQFYARLGEKKFTTIVGERGIKLSGGERQRIGIARAIIKNPEILIFDEATSSLDTENEKYVMEAIDNVSKGKTTIIIAHRLSTIRNADKIIVMDKGKLVGQGTHDELLATNDVYKNLVAHQL
jgi:ABC-type multidrug transport system fused ATPase/permease subunit